MNVVGVSPPPPVGPSWAPAICRSSHGMAPGATNAESVDDAIAAAQIALVSRECCQVARRVPFSAGFGLRKRAMTWRPESSSNNVACGPKNVHAIVAPDGRQM